MGFALYTEPLMLRPPKADHMATLVIHRVESCSVDVTNLKIIIKSQDESIRLAAHATAGVKRTDFE